MKKQYYRVKKGANVGKIILHRGESEGFDILFCKNREGFSDFYLKEYLEEVSRLEVFFEKFDVVGLYLIAALLFAMFADAMIFGGELAAKIAFGTMFVAALVVAIREHKIYKKG